MGTAWFVAEWVKCVLIDGFGFEFDQQPSAQREDDLSFRPFGGTANAELTWTLGRAVLYANKINEQDTEFVTSPGLDIIAERHQKKLNDAMIAKAVRLEESLWDYITMAASFKNRGDVRGNTERASRMTGLAKAAAKTARNLRQAATGGVAQEGMDEVVDEAVDNAVDQLGAGDMDREVSQDDIDNLIGFVKIAVGELDLRDI